MKKVLFIIFFLSWCLFTSQHLLVKGDFCFHWKFNPKNTNYESAQLSEMAEGGSAFLVIFVRKRWHFFQRMPIMSPEMGKMRRNVVLEELVLHGFVKKTMSQISDFFFPKVNSALLKVSLSFRSFF